MSKSAQQATTARRRPANAPVGSRPRRLRLAAPVAKRLYLSAEDVLLTNLISVGENEFLAAGANQFLSFWTRDFAYAARGLLQIGRHDVVQQQVETLAIAARESDGLVPRTMDSMPPQLRVIACSALNLMPKRIRKGLRLGMGKKVRAQHIDEHGSLSMDSNLLVLLAALDLVDSLSLGNASQRARVLDWWNKLEPQFVKLYRFYDGHFRRGLIYQPPYSDWQDSVKRDGHTFYINLLFWVTSQRLRAYPAFGVTKPSQGLLRQRIERTFFDSQSGLYRSVAGMPHISLDGNLLAIDRGYLHPGTTRAARLYRALRTHELFLRNDLPGFVTDLDYPRAWPHLASRIAGLRHYHDRMYWSWLMALAAKVADRMGDNQTASKILVNLARFARRDGSVAEIFSAKPPFKRWSSWCYRSEMPFSWGAGVLLDALVSADYISSKGPVNDCARYTKHKRS